MNKAILFFALLLVANTTFAQPKSDKTLVKTMDPKGTSAINFDFRHKGIDSKPWDEGFIRVELEITANFPEAVLAQLVKAGRYTLSSSIDGEMFSIAATNLDKTVTIGGKDLDDHIRVNIQTPGYYAVTDGVLQKNFPGGVVEQIVARATTMEEASEMIKKIRKIKESVDIKYSFVFKKDKDGEKAADGKVNNKAAAISPNDKRAAGNTGLIPGKKKALGANAGLNDVEQMYGDIIIGGMALDNFND